MADKNDWTPQQEIVHKLDQENEDKYFAEKCCAEDFSGPSPYGKEPPRKYTKVDREIYLRARNEHQQAFNEYTRKLSEEAKQGHLDSWSGPLYKRAVSLQNKLFEISPFFIKLN